MSKNGLAECDLSHDARQAAGLLVHEWEPSPKELLLPLSGKNDALGIARFFEMFASQLAPIQCAEDKAFRSLRPPRLHEIAREARSPVVVFMQEAKRRIEPPRY